MTKFSARRFASVRFRKKHTVQQEKRTDGQLPFIYILRCRFYCASAFLFAHSRFLLLSCIYQILLKSEVTVNTHNNDKTGGQQVNKNKRQRTERLRRLWKVALSTSWSFFRLDNVNDIKGKKTVQLIQWEVSLSCYGFLSLFPFFNFLFSKNLL